MMKRELFAALKVLAIFLCACIAFFVYEYRWGKMYGGLYYQRKGFSSEAKIALFDYCRDQKAYFRANGKFNPSLHNSKSFREELRNFKVGFSDVPEIAKQCPDCVFGEKSFKVAAVGSYKSEDVVWVVDDTCNIRALKE